jgi:hypothetical protein
LRGADVRLDGYKVTLIDQADVDYQIYKLTEGMKVYKAKIGICDDDKTPFETCRAAYANAKPLLDNLQHRLGMLQGVWQSELIEKPSMPALCRDDGTKLYNAFGHYVYEEERLVSLASTTDSTSPSSMARMNKELEILSPAERSAIAELRNLPAWPKECSAY